MDNEINDKRIQKEFSKVSFSGYKKTEAKKELQKAILNSRVEPANYWACEMICAGHFLDLWEIIILITNKFIHYGNPKLPIYLDLRITEFKEILTNGYIGNELKMRNNGKIRRLFSEIISILVFSNKKHSYDVHKIQKTDFDLTEIKFRLKADNLSYGEKHFLKDDPKELFIAINELAYSINHKNINKNSSDACYWIDWILEFDKISKSKKQPLICETRSNIPVMSKFQTDIIWIIWNLFISESEKHPVIVKRITMNLLSLYCLHYSNVVKRKRRYILYFVISLLTEKINYNVPLQTNITIIGQIKERIDMIYREIKKNEVKPETDYLFNNIKKSNLDKTIEKIDIMNNIGLLPRS